MNTLPHEKRAELKRLLLAGNSIRACAQAVQCSKQTVTRYARQWLVTPICECGKQASKHRGFCAARYARSPKRQAWMRGVYNKGNTPGLFAEAIRNAHDVATALNHQLGPFVRAEDTWGVYLYARCLACSNRVRVNGPSQTYPDREPTFEGTAVRRECEPSVVKQRRRDFNRQLQQERIRWHEARSLLKQARQALRQHT